MICSSKEGALLQSYELDNILQTYHRTDLKFYVIASITFGVQKFQGNQKILSYCYTKLQVILRLRYTYQINFIGANFYCLERQSSSDLYQMASLPLSKYCIKSLQTRLIGDYSSKQQHKLTAMILISPCHFSALTDKVCK